MGQALRTPPEFWKEIVRISGTKEHGKGYRQYPNIQSDKTSTEPQKFANLANS
jgi:hypothetical protein